MTTPPSAPSPQSPAHSRRLMSLDALRGFDMFWIVGGEGVVHAFADLAGWSLLLLALFYVVIDVWGYAKWAFFFVVIGMNSILIYMAGRFIDFTYTTDFLFAGLLAPLGEPARLVLWWMGFILVEWAFLYFLYRKRVFLRV